MSIRPPNPDEIGEELPWLEKLLREASMCDGLTDWEGDFVSSLQVRVDEYGERTRISERQQEVLERIERKMSDL